MPVSVFKRVCVSNHLPSPSPPITAAAASISPFPRPSSSCHSYLARLRYSPLPFTVCSSISIHPFMLRRLLPNESRCTVVRLSVYAAMIQELIKWMAWLCCTLLPFPSLPSLCFSCYIVLVMPPLSLFLRGWIDCSPLASVQFYTTSCHCLLFGSPFLWISYTLSSFSSFSPCFLSVISR